MRAKVLHTMLSFMLQRVIDQSPKTLFKPVRLFAPKLEF